LVLGEGGVRREHRDADALARDDLRSEVLRASADSLLVPEEDLMADGLYLIT
jgi:hypothetical protein